MTLVIALFALSAVILVIVTITLVFLNSSKEHRYNEDIEFLEMAMKNWIVNDSNFRIITEMFEGVWRNNCNPQRTSKAYARFKRKYKEFSPYILAELVNQN